MPFARLATVTALLGLLGCGSPSAVELLRRSVQAEYTLQLKPDITLRKDSASLQIRIQGPPLQGLTDSLFEMESREVARFALSHYAAAGTLRGIEITGGQTVIDGPGLKLFRPEHTRSFSVPELR